MKIFKFLTILALGANALSEREQRRQKRREEIERDGELGEEDAKVSSITLSRDIYVTKIKFVSNFGLKWVQVLEMTVELICDVPTSRLVIKISFLSLKRSVCKFIFKQFLKLRDDKYERERREERHDRRYEYEEDKR